MHVYMNILDNINLANVAQESVDRKDSRKQSFRHFSQHYTYIFHKQPVYKQLAFRRQIAKQRSRLNSLSSSNNKSYRLKKSGFFSL